MPTSPASVINADPLARWLDPEIRQFIARTNGYYPDQANTGGIERSRALYDRLCASFRGPRPAGVTVAEEAVPVPWGLIPTRRYCPPGEARPAFMLYVHGGGFVLGGLESHDDVCAELCHDTAMCVLAVDYRLAPEHVFPAALDDVEAAYASLAEAGRPVIVAGDSAGGHLAASLCHRLRRLGERQPHGQVLIYPGLSSDSQRVAGTRAATAPLLTATDVAYYSEVFAGGAGLVPHGNPEFAPLDATHFAGLAPAAIFAAGYDPLHQDAEDYAAALHAAGVAVSYRSDPGLVHGWLRARRMSKLAAAAFAAVIQATVELAAVDAA